MCLPFDVNDSDRLRRWWLTGICFMLRNVASACIDRWSRLWGYSCLPGDGPNPPVETGIQRRGERNDLKITFFTDSVVGYVNHPTAIYTRGLAHGLSLRGNDVRIVEPRQNEAMKRTLREVGSGASRDFHDNFRTFQHHTYEPRYGAPLLEWVTREIALIDVAVAVAGLDSELCRWLANLTRVGLVRGYLTFEPDLLTDEAVALLELDKLDQILAIGQPAASIGWQPIPRAVAAHDVSVREAAGIVLPDDDAADPIRAAEAFEAAVAGVSVPSGTA